MEDPEFYRPLWKALLNSQGAADATGLATPERLERNRAAWRALLEAGQDEGLLDGSVSSDLLERTLSSFANGAMLAWAMGTLSTQALLPSTALGYALALRGVATPAGARILRARIDACQAALE